MPNGLPDSAEPIKPEEHQDNGLPPSAELVHENNQPQLLNLPGPKPIGTPIPLANENKPPTGLFDQGSDLIHGILGLPSVHSDPNANKYYDIGNLIQTGLGVIGGASAAGYGAYKLGKKVLGASDDLGDLKALETGIPKVNIDDKKIVDDVKMLHPDLGAENATPLLPEGELNPVEKLNNALKEAKPLRAQQEKIYSAEKGKRIAESEAVTTRGEAGAKEALSKLQGEYEKVGSPRMNLDQSDVDQLHNIYLDSPDFRPFEKRRLTVALTKILNGQVPQENELALLTKAYGPDTAALARTQRIGLLKSADSAAKTALTTWDFSAPGRQGLPLIHTKEFWTSLDDQFKAWGSEKGFNAVQDSVRESPTYDLGQEVGLKLYDVGGTMGPRPERLANQILDKLPGVRRSGRAYTAFLNKLRQDHFNSLMSDAKFESDVAQDSTLNPFNNLDKAKKIADFVNTATGSGSLGKLEKNAGLLNDAFFAPRLQASRIKMLSNPINPNFWMNEDPFVKKQYLKSLAAWAGSGLTIGELSKMGGGEVNNDPNSTDFRKIKIGNTRLDPFAGGQQYVVAMAKLLSNEAQSSTSNRSYGLGEPLPWGKKHKYGDPTGLDTIENFALYKTSPLVSFGAAMLRGKDFDNQPFEIKKAIANRFIPIILQDLYDTAKDDPRLLPITVPASLIGVNTQTYGQ